MKNRSFEELSIYYQKEMDYLIEEGNEFFKKHYHASKNIEWGPTGSNDPHIQRMLESFAFLTGAIQQQIDTTSSNLNFHIINTICPMFTRSIPCSCIMKTDINDASIQDYGKIIKSGSQIIAKLENKEEIKYKTIYDIQILPIKISKIEFINLKNFDIKDSKTTIGIKIQIQTIDGLNIKDLMKIENFNKIRLYINTLNKKDINIYEMLNTYDEFESPTTFIKFGNQIIKNSVISSPGFEDEESLYNHDNFTNPSLKLMTEINILHEKFLFFDINLDQKIKEKIIEQEDQNSQIEIDFIIPITNSVDPEIKNIETTSLELMCSPVINLFPTSSEYIFINNKQSNYKLIPYKRNEKTNEVYSIHSVISQRNNSEIKYQPYFGGKNILDNSSEDFWIETREVNNGTYTFVSFVSSNFTDSEVAYANITCTNRDLPSFIDPNTSFFTSIPKIQMKSISRVTNMINPPIGLNLEWSIISHLATNYITFSKDNSLKKIKDLISMYRFIINENVNTVSDEIIDIHFEKTLEPSTFKNFHYFISKIIISITINDSTETSFNLFLLGKVLHVLFVTESEINTVIETIIIKKSNNKIWKKYKSHSKREII